MGSLPVGSAAYPVPQGAVFISPAGSDQASGQLSAPWKTLAHAAIAAPNGSTIVARAGTYHESVDIPSNRNLSIQAYPGEPVWLDGSSVVTGWRKSGSVWIHDGWTAQFSSLPGYNSGAAGNTAPGWTFVNAAHPMAAHPDQVWRAGVALAQVGTAQEVASGKFYVDYSSHQLIVGSDPSGTEVRASDLGVALSLRGAHSAVRGIGVRRYADSIPDVAALRLIGDHDSIENVVITQNATTGLTAIASNISVSHVTTEYNGLLGMHSSTADGLSLQYVLADHNNTEQFNYAPVSGGVKIGRSRGVQISHSDFTDNLGVGLWLDESVYRANVLSSRMTGNASHGMSFEIGSTGVLADNIVTGNGGDGFKINNTDHVRLWNNLISNNSRNVEVVQDARRGARASDPGHDPRQAQPDPTMPWINSGIELVNNVIGRPAAGSYELYAFDYSAAYTAAQMMSKVDGNEFATVTGGGQVVWGTGGKTLTIYNTMSLFNKLGMGSGNADAGAAAGARPVALPSDIASMISQPTGSRQVGPFSH